MAEQRGENILTTERCPICNRPAECGHPSRDEYQVLCTRCGPFILTGTARAMLRSRLDNKLAIARASHFIRSTTSAENWVEIDSDLIEEIVKFPLPSMEQQVGNLLLWIASKLGDNRLGAVEIPDDEDELAGIIGVVDGNQVDSLMSMVEKEELIKYIPDRAVQLTLAGWRVLDNQKQLPPAIDPIVAINRNPREAGPHSDGILGGAVKDTDLRGIILRRLYDLRHERAEVFIPGGDLSFPDLSDHMLGNVCVQLAEHGVIEYKPHRSSSSGQIDIGRARITALGVDVIEGNSTAPVPINTVRNVIESAMHHDISKVPSGNLDKVFIGHGRSEQWRALKDFIRDRMHLQYEEFNQISAAGVSTQERLSEMLDQCTFAFLVLTGEDVHQNESIHARENVIHEAGLFQGRLGWRKAIVVLEEGCEEFSNIVGLGQIRFPQRRISGCFEDIRQVLEREGVVSSTDART